MLLHDKKKSEKDMFILLISQYVKDLDVFPDAVQIILTG